MKFDTFLDQIQALPVIEVENLLAGQPKAHADALRVQLARWHKAGKLIQLKRGFYILKQPFRKRVVYAFYVATLLKSPSYTSLEKALEFYDLIPEAVSVFTSVTPKRPGCFRNPLGVFQYHHMNPSLFWGYESITQENQTGFIASPEKCLLDLFYFYDGEVTGEYLDGLRLQNLEILNVPKLFQYAKKFKKPKIMKATQMLSKYILNNQSQEETL